MTLDTFTKTIPAELMRIMSEAEQTELETIMREGSFATRAKFIAGPSVAIVVTNVMGIANWISFIVLTPDRKFWGIAYDDRLQIFEDMEPEEEQA